MEMNYINALEKFNDACKEFLEGANSGEFSYNEGTEGKVGFCVDKEKRIIEFFVNDIKFKYRKDKFNYYYLERTLLNFPDAIIDHLEKDPYCLLILAKAFLELGTGNDDQFMKDIDKTDSFRLLCLKMAKALNDLHGSLQIQNTLIDYAELIKNGKKKRFVKNVISGEKWQT